MTTISKASKRRVPASGQPVDGSSIPANPVHVRGSLSMAQAVASTRLTHRQYTHTRLTEGKVVPLSHGQLSNLVDILEYMQGSSVASMRNWQGIGDLRDQLIELLTYDVLDCNGQPPSLGFICLPIDEFRRIRE